MLAVAVGLGSTALAQVPPINTYTQRFIDLRAKIHNPANGYFSPDGVPYHTPETLICEAPDYGHETTSEAYSYWIWLEAMNGRVTGDWTALNAAWTKMEAKAIPTPDLQPTTSSYNPAAPATYAGEWPLPDNYPSPLIPVAQAPVGQDPVSPDLTATYGSNIYGMHWIFDCDNFYGFGNKGDGISTPAYMNTFQRGEQESVWETIPQPCWESFKWGSGAAGGYLTLFTKETSAPTMQWKYTNAPDADARAVQAIYWAVQFAKEQGLNPTTTLPVAKASKMGDFGRLAMFDKYFKTIGSQSLSGGAGTGYSSAHFLVSWYYAWGGPLTPQGWAWRIGSSHAHFGYQNPVSALALSTSPELKAISANGARDWAQSLTRQLEFYQWLQSAEGAIAGGATNSLNGRYDPYPVGTPTFHGMAYQENPVYHDPGSNTWFGFQAWSMERVAEYYYITGDAKIKPVLDKWIAWVKSVVHLTADGSFDLPSEIGWSGAPNTWDPVNPVPNTNLHVIIVSSGQDLGIAAATAKALTYYAAATQKFGALDTASRDLAQQILDRMWAKFLEPTGRGVATPEDRKDFTRFFSQTVFVPSFFSGKMPNGDAIVPGIKFLDIRSQYRNDPDFPALQAAVTAGVPFRKTYHRFWAEADIALANAEFGRFFGGGVVTPPVPVTSVTVSPVSGSVNVNGTLALTATVAPATATNKSVTWTSGSPAVATVSAAGVVTGVSAGSATITVRTVDGGFTATSSILVNNILVPVSGVTVTPATVTVAVGATAPLTAAVLPATASNKSVTFTSSAPAVATVSATGVVTGVSAGSATITVRTVDGGFTATSSVTVTPANNPVPVTGVTVTPVSVAILVGANTTLTAVVAPANATNKAVTWTSSNPAVASVSAAGVVTGVSAGSATITVRTVNGNFAAVATVMVNPVNNPIAVTGVTVAPTTASVAVGATTSLAATVAPANATNKAVTWTSSSPAIATVSASGVVTGVAAGSATITVRTTDGGFTATATVTVTGGGGGCSTPTPITLSFAKDGVGEFCYVTSGNINFINSWNMQLVEVNGVAFTNRWSNSLPAKVNGTYVIHYVGTFPWSHLEINGTP